MIALQMPDAAKRARADYVVRTGLSRFHAVRAVRRLVVKIIPKAPVAILPGAGRQAQKAVLS
jgi:dephospho-CoA kinase